MLNKQLFYHNKIKGYVIKVEVNEKLTEPYLHPHFIIVFELGDFVLQKLRLEGITTLANILT